MLQRLAGGDALGRVQRQQAVEEVEAGIGEAAARVQGGGRRELGAQQVVRLLRELDLQPEGSGLRVSGGVLSTRAWCAAGCAAAAGTWSAARGSGC